MDNVLRADATDTVATDPRDKEVGVMLLVVLRSLVDRGDEVSMVPLADANGISFQVHAPADEVGKLIGKGGRTARAIRVILGANAIKNRRRYSIDFSKNPE